GDDDDVDTAHVAAVGAARARIRAGLPATTAPAGTSRVTTAPAPTSAPSPIVTPPRTTAPEPIEAPRSTRVRRSIQSASVWSSPSSVVARGYLSLTKITPWPTKTSSARSTPSQTKEWLSILQRAPTLTPRWISTNGPTLVSSPIRQP